MPDKNAMIKWMSDRVGKVTYSMINRLGPNSYDCSSAVYYALIAGGFLPQGTAIGNTETLFNDLEKNGWKQVQPNADGSITAKKGNIFIWGNRGYTLGSAGHTGIFINDSDQIIHCNYGYNGITINDHDTIWAYNGKPAVTIYEYVGTDKTNSKPSATPKPQPTNSTGQKVNQGIYRVDDIQHVNGIWQVHSNYLVPVDFNWTDNGISVEDIVLVDSKGYILSDQTTKVGSLFVFDTNKIKSVGAAQSGSGGYKWAPVNLTHSGNIWLSVIDKNDLINKVSNA